jgi:serine protease Do
MAESTPSLLRPVALVAAAAFGLGGAVIFSNLLVPQRSLLVPAAAEAQLLDPSQPFAISDVAELVLPAVVSVTTKTVREMPQGDVPGMFRYFDPFFEMGPGGSPRESTGEGSGVIVDAKRGLVLTNHHVAGNATSISVTLSDGTVMDAEVVGTDPTTDVGVLRLKPDGPMPRLSEVAIGDSSALRLGEIVLAVGNPFGYSSTVTMGIVSAKGRADTGITTYGDFIQTDAAINPGNSGGALVNMRGELVGINTAIATRSGSSAGIGFAIPTSIALPIMTSLVDNGRVARGYLGITMQELDDPDVAASLGAPGARGVIVADVAPGSPADKGGVRPGDIVQRVDGVVTDSMGRLRTEVALRPAGKKVAVEVLREGKPRKLQVTLEEQPDTMFAALNSPRRGSTPEAAPPGDLDGLVVGPLDGSARKQLELDPDVKGVVVESVAAGSVGQRAGLQPGDVVMELNRQPVKDVKDFEQRWAASRDNVMLRVKRGPGVLFIVVAR